MSDLLSSTFAELLDVAYLDGAGLVKWGGDAVLLLFQGDDHAARACRAAYRMRARMRTVGKLETSAGRVVLRMSVGVHSGTFHFFLVGDPTYHRELHQRSGGQPLPTGRAALTRMGHFLRPAGHGRYRFEHALIRDAAYEGLPFRRRQDLHGRVGEHLENAADDPDEWSELLLRHYFHVGCAEKAWHYSRVAGDRAREKSATVEAVQFYTRALAAGRSLKELDARERADVLELLGDAHTNLGALADALAVLRQARRLRRDDPRDFARVCQKEALVHQYADRFSLALRTLSHGLSALDAADLDAADLDAADLDAVGSQPAAENAAERDGTRRGIAVSRSHLEATYASCRLRQGRAADAISWATRAEADAEAAADKPALARAYDLLFGVYLTRGRTPPKPYGSLALALLEELDSVHLQAQILNQLGYFEIVQGHGTAASDYFERARAAFVRAGDSTSAAMVAHNVGDHRWLDKSGSRRPRRSSPRRSRCSGHPRWGSGRSRRVASSGASPYAVVATTRAARRSTGRGRLSTSSASRSRSARPASPWSRHAEPGMT